MKPLSDRERRLAALAILLLLLAVVWLLLVRPLMTGFSARRQQREETAAALARNERLIAALPAWRRAGDDQRRTAGRFAIAAPSQAAAAELLKQRLAALVTRVGGVVGGVEDTGLTLGPDTVSARADAQLTLSQLYDMLRRLQAEEPYVAVEYLSVTADRAFETGRAGPAGVRLEVSARFRRGEGR